MITAADIATISIDDIAPVVEFDPSKQRIIAMDFTAANTALTSEVLADTTLFEQHVCSILASKNALYGIGGYAEHRTIYQRSELFDGTLSSDEPRRLHLGTDIWGKAHTRVYSPLEGYIHSTGFHEQQGNYGAVMIIEHQVNGKTFFTLYGHLTFNSIQGRKAGDRIARGELIASFGQPHENGHWPPHLHFQLISDLQGWMGDYPGVCKYSERADWLSRSPDPDLLLHLNRYVA